MAQIDEKLYAKPFERDPRKRCKIGVNFSNTTNCMDEWKGSTDLSYLTDFFFDKERDFRI